MTQTTIAIITSLLLLVPAAVQAQFTYTTNNDTITIAKYTGSDSLVTIPSTKNGLRVTSIGTNAFSYCTHLTSVTIPDSINIIGSSAFYACRLTSVTVPKSVTSIGDFAFGYCPLTNVTIHTGVLSCDANPRFHGGSFGV